MIGADPLGRVGEAPRIDLAQKFGRISGACFNAAAGKQELMIMGTSHQTSDGTCVRDYIHVSDLVEAHVLAINAFLPGQTRVYNVGVGKGYSVRQFVEACKNVTGAKIKVVEAPARDGDAAEVYCDPAKIKRELKWEPRFTDLQLSLSTAWQWQSQHPQGYT